MGWNPLPLGWVKLNIDGTYKGNSSLVSKGELIADEVGIWRDGFARKVGVCCALKAK